MRRAPAVGTARIVSTALALLLLSASGHAAELTFELRIEGGKVAANMRRIRANQGDGVTLRWRTDRPIVLHLHGYDIETKVEPGAVAEMKFLARATGRFPVEVHTAGGGAHGHAPLIHVDVVPR